MQGTEVTQVPGLPEDASKILNVPFQHSTATIDTIANGEE